MLRNVNLAYSGYFFKIYLVGRFYSIRVLDEKRIVLKFGYSKDIIYNLPFGLDFFLLNNRKGYYLFYSINYGLIKNLVFYLRKLREVSPYTGRGVRYYKEKVDRKEGKAVFI
jgi:ribosomal protein L6P/L9E